MFEAATLLVNYSNKMTPVTTTITALLRWTVTDSNIDDTGNFYHISITKNLIRYEGVIRFNHLRIN